jgi:hypothetical protein
VAEDPRELRDERQAALDRMQIGMADARCRDADEDLARTRSRIRDVFDDERRTIGVDASGAHLTSFSVVLERDQRTKRIDVMP